WQRIDKIEELESRDGKDYVKISKTTIRVVDGENTVGEETTQALFRDKFDYLEKDLMKIAQAVYGMGIAAADVNHDGFMDYFVTSIGRPMLLTGNATGSFDDATELYGLSVPLADTGYQVTWGAVFEDFNGDGALDLLAAGGHIPAISYLGNQDEMPNMLWQGTPNPPWTADPTGWFLQQVEESSGRSLSVADFNQDGRADIALGHASGVIALYQNLSKVDPPLRLQLKPNVTGPRGAGARVSVQSGDCTRYFESNGGGSYGGTYDSEIRITLPSKCLTAEPIELSIRWPSGYLQSLTATQSQSLNLSEPKWLWFEGNNLFVNWPQTQSIKITATGAVMEKTLQNSDGTWSAQFAPEVDVATALFSIERNGKLLSVHPRKEWPQANTVKLRNYPKLVTVGSQFTLYMTLLNADGKAVGPSSPVSVVADTNKYDSKYQGAGTFMAQITAPATPGPFEFQVMVDNKALGGMQSIDIKPLIDPGQSQQIITGLYKNPDALVTPENATFNIQVKLRDYNGSMVIAETDGFTLMVNAAPVVPTEVITSDNEALLIVNPTLIPDQAEVQLLHKGFPIAAPQTAHVLNAPKDQSAFINVERSFCATAMTKIHADEQDVVTGLLFLSDKHGNILLPPITDLQFNASNATLVNESLHAKDDFYQMTFRAGKEVGPAVIDVSAFGLPTGVNCSFTLLAPKQLPAALSNELSIIKASPSKLPTDGLGTSHIRVIPRLPGGRAYGSGLEMNISSTMSDFTGPTRYSGKGRYTRVLKAGAKAGFATISGKMNEPKFLVQTLVTFFEDNSGSEDTGTDTTVIEEEVVEESPEQAPEESSVVEEVSAERPTTVEDTPDAGTILPDDATVVETGDPESDATVSPVEEEEKLPPASDGGCAITTHTTHAQPVGFFFIWLLLGGLYICHHRQRGGGLE
ncbi:MAG TPA: VCBS repeat-containing protein, partial [Myxococcales bacterium]|nr:VCBS repeat-containing protein [Myxococcales bacterium]